MAKICAKKPFPSGIDLHIETVCINHWNISYDTTNSIVRVNIEVIV